jgi:glycosyltransferase
MKISVITVCLNSERTIGYTIQSFLDQTWPNKEMLIIDGGSRDRTLDIANSFPSDQLRVWSEPDRGIYDAMNKGLQFYSGHAVGFLNSDDRFHDSSALDSIAAGLSGADVVYGDLIFVSDHGSKRVLRTWKAGQYHRRSFQFGWLPPHPTFYLRRSLADRVGNFDLNYGSAADYDFMLRAMHLPDASICYVPRILVDFQHGGKSTASISGYITSNLNCLKSRRRHLRSAPVDIALFVKPLRKLHQFQWRR